MDFEESDRTAQQTAGHGSAEPDEDYRASDVDNTDLPRSVDLSSFKLKEYKGSDTDYKETGSTTIYHATNTSNIEKISGSTMYDRTYEIEAVKAAPAIIDVGDVIVGQEDKKYNENEVLYGDIQIAPSENGSETQLPPRRREECNKLGRGDCCLTLDHDNFCNFHKHIRKKAYFHLGRRVKQKIVEETRLSTGSRSTSPTQRGNTTQKLSSREDRSVEMRSTKRTWKSLSKIGRPIRYGFRTLKHPVTCNLRNKIKECRIAIQHYRSAGSTNDCSLPVQSTRSSGNCALYMERLLSTGSAIGAQHQKQLHQPPNDTSPGDRQKNVTSNNVVADDDNDRQQERHLQRAKTDDQRELPSNACRPLISGHTNACESDRAVLLPARLETDKKECRYSDERYDVGKQSRKTLQQECCPANYILDNDRSRKYEDQRPLCDSRQAASTIGDSEERCLSESDICLSASCTAPLVQSISRSTSIETIPSAKTATPLSLLPSSSDMRSGRETPRSVVKTGCSETTATISTTLSQISDAYSKEPYGDMYTGHNVIAPEKEKIPLHDVSVKMPFMINKIPTGNSLIHEKPHVGNTLSPLAADRKMSEKKGEGNEIVASESPSATIKVKCSKNKDNNIRYEKERRDGRQSNCQPTKTLPRRRWNEQHTYRQYDSMIQQMQELVVRCESSAQECKKTLDDMTRLLHQNWSEKFWQQWIMQQMGIQISQLENNATVMPESVGKQRSKATDAAYTHRPRVFTPKPGNVKSTMLSTEPAHSQSSSLTSALGLAGSCDKLKCRQCNLIQSKAVEERASIASLSPIITASMSSPVKSSFQSSTNSSFQNYTHRLPAVRMARTKQTARKNRDDQQRSRERRQKEIDAAIGAIRHREEDGAGRRHLSDSSVYSVD